MVVQEIESQEILDRFCGLENYNDVPEVDDMIVYE